MRRGLLLKGDLTRPTFESRAAGAGGWLEGKGLPACTSSLEQKGPLVL